MLNYNESLNHIHAIKAKYESELLTIPNVLGVGVGLRRRADRITEDICIVVMVNQKYALENLHPDEVIPSEIEGIPTDVQEAGVIEA